jgi:hypothetical protein
VAERGSYGCSTGSSPHTLVERHPEHEGERITAQQLVGGVVLGDSQGRHPGNVPHHASRKTCSTAATPTPT